MKHTGIKLWKHDDYILICIQDLCFLYVHLLILVVGGYFDELGVFSSVRMILVIWVIKPLLETTRF